MLLTWVTELECEAEIQDGLFYQYAWGYTFACISVKLNIPGSLEN